MATVTDIKKTEAGQPGTHYVEFEQFKGPDNDSSFGTLFIKQYGEGEDIIEGVVVDGCDNGLELHSLGDKVHIHRIPATDRYFIGSAEN